MTDSRLTVAPLLLMAMAAVTAACAMLNDGWAVDRELQFLELDGDYSESALPIEAYEPARDFHLVLEMRDGGLEYDVVRFESSADGDRRSCLFVIATSGSGQETDGECGAPIMGRSLFVSRTWVLVTDDSGLDMVKIRHAGDVVQATMKEGVALLPIECRQGADVDVQFGDDDERTEACPF